MFGIEKISEEWMDYGFRELYLTWNGEPVPWKAIVRGGKLIHIASRRYTLLPNEVALRAADVVAEEIGAEKIKEFLDPCGRLYVLYDMKVEAEPIRDVKTRLGIYVYNSVEGWPAAIPPKWLPRLRRQHPQHPQPGEHHLLRLHAL